MASPSSPRDNCRDTWQFFVIKEMGSQAYWLDAAEYPSVLRLLLQNISVSIFSPDGETWALRRWCWFIFAPVPVKLYIGRWMLMVVPLCSSLWIVRLVHTLLVLARLLCSPPFPPWILALLRSVPALWWRSLAVHRLCPIYPPSPCVFGLSSCDQRPTDHPC